MGRNSFISQDITFCMTEGCPIREYCHRAIGCKKRIASYSDYSTLCNVSNVFAMFVQAEKEDMERVKGKKC